MGCKGHMYWTDWDNSINDKQLYDKKERKKQLDKLINK